MAYLRNRGSKKRSNWYVEWYDENKKRCFAKFGLYKEDARVFKLQIEQEKLNARYTSVPYP